MGSQCQHRGADSTQRTTRRTTQQIAQRTSPAAQLAEGRKADRARRSCAAGWRAAGVVLALTTLAAGVPAWAGYNVWTGEYSVTHAELERVVAQRFPVTLRYAQVFDVRLSNPRLSLDAGRNRMTTVVDTVVSNTLLPGAPIQGTLALDSGILYDAPTREVRLDHPTVERVDVRGMPGPYAQQLGAIGNLVAQQVLHGYALHTFRPEELRFEGREIVPGDIHVTEEGLSVKINTR